MPIDLNTGSEDFRDHKLLFINKLNEIEGIARTALECIEDTDQKVLDMEIKNVEMDTHLKMHSKILYWTAGTVASGLLTLAIWLVKVFVLEK